MTFNLFKRLLPLGRAWAIVAEKRLRQFFEGLAAGASDPVVKEFDDRFDDINPQYTTQLALWEDQFSLPAAGLTEQERRDRLQGAWSAVGGQSPRYVQDTLQAAGFDVYVHEWWAGVEGSPAFTNLGAQFSTFPTAVACSADGSVVYVTDRDADSLYRSTNSGTSFTNLGAMFGSAPAGVACSADGSVVYVRDADSLYRSTNSGTSFTNLGAQFGLSPSAVACSADGSVVYVTDTSDDSLYRSTNSGTSFTNLGAQFGLSPSGVACSADGSVVYVVDTSDDSLYRSTNSGTSFTNLGAQFGTFAWVVACSADGSVVYVLDDGPVYRSTNSGTSFTNLGAPFTSSPSGIVCSADGSVVYAVDPGNDSLYRSTTYGSPVTGSPPPKGSINGVPAPVARNPFDYIVDPANPVKFVGAGHDLAYCGGDDMHANAQELNNPQGYLLVNKITQSTSGFVGSGHDLAYCGGDSAASGVSQLSGSKKVYTIPSDPTKYPYFLYIGGQTFPDLATVPQARRDEFENLCLKICPAQQWLGILVSYT